MTSKKPWANRHIYFIGIGGSGMSGLALVAHRLGAVVSGSDQKDSFYIESLRRAGIKNIFIGHKAANVPKSGDVVFSSAIHKKSSGFIERETAKKYKLRELHRSELLAEITREHHTTIAVAGAHGKTTTAGMIAHILEACGKDPSYIIGGLLLPPALHARAGDRGILVIEADESDKSLLNYKVDVSVITSIDLDHVGDAGYKSVDEVARVFADFSKNAHEVIVAQGAVKTLQPHIAKITKVEPHVKQQNFVVAGHSFTTNQPGQHNAENAALAVTVALHLGCEPSDIRQALETFPGVAGRFELRGKTAKGAQVYDDYAHHPAEVAAAVETGQTLTKGKVFAVFQPHLFSRTKQFLPDFAQALAAADKVIVEPIYAARENPADWQQVSSEHIVNLALTKELGDFSYINSRAEIAKILQTEPQSDDVILLIGAGDVGDIAELIVQK